MTYFVVFGIFLAGFAIVSGQDEIEGLPTDHPLIIAHRGSSGMRPEHTVAAYQLAVEQGADVIECDLAVTKDLKLICSHDPWLSESTNIESFPEFDDRKRNYTIAGNTRTDYYIIDFTMEELKRLRKVQSRSYRDQSYNGLFPMANFDEYVAVARNESNGRTIGIYPETKVPSFFNNFLSDYNTTMEDILLSSLSKYGYEKRSSPCFVQSFSEKSLRYISNHSSLPLVFLTSIRLSDKKLSDLSKFCYGVGPPKTSIILEGPNRKIIGVTDFVKKAHQYGLKIHPYTFRNEDQFLAFDYGADPYLEYEKFLEAEIDGYFTDFPWSLANYLEKRNSGCRLNSSLNLVFLLSLFTTFLLK